MKNLSEQQQMIVDSIVSEFERINTQSQAKQRKFNFIDVNELDAINREIEENKRIAEQDNESWSRICRAKAERVAKALQEDLPMLDVYIDETKSNTNGCDWCVRIGNNKTYTWIKVCVDTESVKQSHGCWYAKGIGLYYMNSERNARKTIEEVIEKDGVKERIRGFILEANKTKNSER